MRLPFIRRLLFLFRPVSGGGGPAPPESIVYEAGVYESGVYE